MQAPVQHPTELIHAVALERAAALKKQELKPQRRIMNIGVSGSGKTYAASMCPRPVYLDYDNQINDPDVIKRLEAIYPMWDVDFLKSIGFTGKPDEVLKNLCKARLRDLGPEYTVIVDSGSQYADRVKENIETLIGIDKPKAKGDDEKADGFKLWRLWSKTWRSLCETLAGLTCNVVVNFHEAEIRDEETGRLERYGWMMQGKEFTPRIPQFFTDVVRQTHEVKQKGTSNEIESETWWWQIKPTADFPIAKSRCRQQKIRIPAQWSELCK